MCLFIDIYMHDRTRCVCTHKSVCTCPSCLTHAVAGAYICIYICTYVCVYVTMCVYICTIVRGAFARTNRYTDTFRVIHPVAGAVYVCVGGGVYVCVYVCVCVYIHTHDDIRPPCSSTLLSRCGKLTLVHVCVYVSINVYTRWYTASLSLHSVAGAYIYICV